MGCVGSSQSKSEGKENTEVHLAQLKRFTLKELQAATDNFSNKNILGEGGFGKVYKGRLGNGSIVAIKKLKQEAEGTPEGERQFQIEVEVISMAVHRNLLQLLGFCTTQTERLLVYPYMPNGSVASRLGDRSPSKPVLYWGTRKRIALGSARGLLYLHDQCNSRSKIIHRDVKAANILLDENLEAIVGDFGLAKLMNFKNTHVTTNARGTFGYIAPECVYTGRCSEKSDVYAYGILLLELISGRRIYEIGCLAIDDNDAMLLDWVKGLVKDKKLEKLVDPGIVQNNRVRFEVEQVVNMALVCTQQSPVNRPQMSEIVRILEDEEWEKLKLPSRQVEEVDTTHPIEYRSADSTANLHAIELSGPR